VLIEGYNCGPLVAGDPLIRRSGFWSNYLLGLCGPGVGAGPEWFGDDGADVDAMGEVLLDPDRWPVFRVPCKGGHGIAVVYRNLVGDYGVDYLATHPPGQAAQRIASWEGEVEGGALNWSELTRIVESSVLDGGDAARQATGLLLLLPLLREPALPDEAVTTVTAALVAVGVPSEAAPRTARSLLDHAETGPWHERDWSSPLSGSGAGALLPECRGVLAWLGLA